MGEELQSQIQSYCPRLRRSGHSWEIEDAIIVTIIKKGVMSDCGAHRLSLTTSSRSLPPHIGMDSIHLNAHWTCYPACNTSMESVGNRINNYNFFQLVFFNFFIIKLQGPWATSSNSAATEMLKSSYACCTTTNNQC